MNIVEIVKQVNTDRKHFPEGCLCQSCGKRFRCDFNLPDDQWAMISFGSNLLCGRCIADRIEFELEQAEMFLAFRLEEL